MRPIEALHAVGRRYPEMWRRYDYLLSERGKSLPDWPQWCHCPMAAAYSVVSDCSDRRQAVRGEGAVPRRCEARRQEGNGRLALGVNARKRSSRP